MKKCFEAVASYIKVKQRQINSFTHVIEQVQRQNERQQNNMQVILMENMKLKYSIEEQLESLHLTVAMYNTYSSRIQSFKTTIFALRSQFVFEKNVMMKRNDVNTLKNHKNDLQHPNGITAQQTQVKL